MKLNKLNFSSLPIIVFSTFLFIVGIAVMSSCGAKKGHSVRDMRASKAPYIPKPQEKAMIQPLFLQSKKPTIGLPRQNTAGGTSGGSFAVEQVVYTNADNQTDLFDPNDGEGLNKTFGLNEVVVEARSRFTPERNGKINVDFIVKVPHELISKNWSIRLQPLIIAKDSMTLLDRLVLKGEQFALKQKLDYQAYDDYLNSIVDKADYDDVFLDHEAIQQDIIDRQNFYYDEYHRDWSKHIEYEEWLKEQQRKDAEEKAVIRGELVELKYEYARKALTHAVRDVARGVDTTGLAASYQAQYLKKAAGLQKRLSDKESGKVEVPKKYRALHESKERAKDIENKRMTSMDTINIAKNRYMFDAIIENEMKAQRKEQVFKELVPFTYDTEARIDTIVKEGRDFIYYYKQELPVKPGMKSIKISMASRVTAMDESKYNMQRSDTLSFFISSIAQLVDTTLIHKEKKQLRNAFHRETAYFKYRPNTWRFDVNYKDNRAELNKITEAYNTFNNSKGFAVDSILMQSSTSLEGEYNKNAELSMRRVEDLKKFFVKSTEMGRSRGEEIFTTNYIGEDWTTLVRLLRQRTDMDNRDQIIDMLGNAVDPDGTKDDIKMYKADYKLMQDSIFPKLDKVAFLFNVHRKDMDENEKIIRAEPEYVKGVRLLQNREYAEAMEILANYPDYNAAVCLAALGYNAKAYEIIVKLKSNGNTEYLAAILAWRMNQEQTAENHLFKSIELDQSKLYRIGLDPDINDLVEKRKLQNRINQMK